MLLASILKFRATTQPLIEHREHEVSVCVSPPTSHQWAKSLLWSSMPVIVFLFCTTSTVLRVQHLFIPYLYHCMNICRRFASGIGNRDAACGWAVHCSTVLVATLWRVLLSYFKQSVDWNSAAVPGTVPVSRLTKIEPQRHGCCQRFPQQQRDLRNTSVVFLENDKCSWLRFRSKPSFARPFHHLVVPKGDRTIWVLE